MNKSVTNIDTAIPTPQRYGSTLLIARRGTQNSILLVALHRPKVKNAFSDDQYLDLISILKQVQEDDSISALVLTGMGDYFSSGADLSAFQFDDEDDDDDFDGNYEEESKSTRDKKKGTIDKPAGRFMMTMLSFPKVLCCAVNGPAVGIGVTLLPHCDLVYCTNQSTFWVPFTRIALVPEFASSITFVEAMGMGCANELLLLGEKIDAEKAVSYRLCNGIIHGCNHRCKDAFASDSIASMVCQDLDRKLLSLPCGEKTSRVSTLEK